MKLYLAYGSNLSVEQMERRCPDAKPIGKAILPDWKLLFKIHATIEPCKGSKVPVLVWKISDRDEQNLDRYEGYPSYYTKQDMEILMTDLRGRNPRPVTAMVYIMADGHRVRMPMKGYVDILVEGYERFGFDMDILREALRETHDIAEKEAELYDRFS